MCRAHQVGLSAGQIGRGISRATFSAVLTAVLPDAQASHLTTVLLDARASVVFDQSRKPRDAIGRERLISVRHPRAFLRRLQTILVAQPGADREANAIAGFHDE